MSPGPRHHTIKAILGRFMDDPDFQVRFHAVMMIFWIFNCLAGTTILFLWPKLWVEVGVYYVFLLSIYANFDTDYDAVSAAKAFKHAKRAEEQVQ